MFYLRKRHLSLARPLALALFTLLVPRLAHAQASGYFVTDLTTLGGNQSKAYAINNNGGIAGGSRVAPDNFNAQPFFWSNSQFANIGSFGGDGGEAFAVNDLNYAVGLADTVSGATHPFIWSSIFGKKDLGTLGGDFAVAWDINNASQVVGQSEIGALNDRAFFWSSATGMQSLGTLPGGSSSTARGINNTAQVVGDSGTASGETHAYFYSGGTMTDLGTLGGNLSIAYELNDEGKVVGYSKINNNGINPPYHAFLYTSSGGMTDLGTLPSGRDARFPAPVFLG
ncbi:MAG: hypothetical protein LC754_00795 [Acidobacteria bacterium]|nr:hypothetical protein [Acidobacteriota bacterium]